MDILIAVSTPIIFLALAWACFRPREEFSTYVTMAIGYAHAAHIHQVRKYTGEPYIRHCIEVMETLREIGCSDEILAAAVLHDTVEDTTVTLSDIRGLFGKTTAELVREVTDISTPQDGNRAARKRIDAIHLAHSSAGGATIKLADIISNTSSIAAHDPGFARVYLAEKFALMPLLAHGDKRLFRRACDILLLAQQQVATHV